MRDVGHTPGPRALLRRPWSLENDDFHSAPLGGFCFVELKTHAPMTEGQRSAEGPLEWGRQWGEQPLLRPLGPGTGATKQGR